MALGRFDRKSQISLFGSDMLTGVDYRTIWSFVHNERLAFKKTVVASERDCPRRRSPPESQRQSRAQLIRIADARLFSLSKYSAELNLIGQIFAKLQHLSREAAARPVETRAG